jgi:tetratricopeptide (TPR) repeat protein
MFFSKFFKKDHHHFLAQAEKHLKAERYADARVDFLEALSRCPEGDAEKLQGIRLGLSQAGNALAELNLQEAEHSLNAGDQTKARDHFALARELSDDPKIGALAQAGLKRADQPKPAPVETKGSAHGGSSCGSCKDVGKHGGTPVEVQESDVHEEDRFFLLVQPLPGDLPARYSALGEKFARAYLFIHDGQDAKALPILQEMQLSSENDIVIYELALILYRAGRAHECEAHLNRSLTLNPGNPAAYLALIHLKAEAGKFPEALGVLNRMMSLGIMADQGQFMLGELHEAAGDQGAALEAWSKALETPSVAKAAAERLVPLLTSQGREAEAKYLAKRYLKGCC